MEDEIGKGFLTALEVMQEVLIVYQSLMFRFHSPIYMAKSHEAGKSGRCVLRLRGALKPITKSSCVDTTTHTDAWCCDLFSKSTATTESGRREGRKEEGREVQALCEADFVPRRWARVEGGGGGGEGAKWITLVTRWCGSAIVFPAPIKIPGVCSSSWMDG